MGEGGEGGAGGAGAIDVLRCFFRGGSGGRRGIGGGVGGRAGTTGDGGGVWVPSSSSCLTTFSELFFLTMTGSVGSISIDASKTLPQHRHLNFL